MKLRVLVLFVVASFLSPTAFGQLTAADVQTIINHAVTRAVAVSPRSVIAVTDREGYVLGVWNVAGGEPTSTQIVSAVSKAGTAAFLSSNQNAFTSRTAGFIIQQHFPPGVQNTAPGPLVGVGFSSLSFSDVNRFKQFFGVPPPPIGGTSPGVMGFPIRDTSLDGNPGGVPLYKDGTLVGGVGVTGGNPTEDALAFIPGPAVDEDVALSGQHGYRPSSDITADNVYIGGISLAYTATSTNFSSTVVLHGNVVLGYPIQSSPRPFPYPVATFGGVTGQIRQPIISDPMPGLINGQARLTAAEVASIINYAADRVRTTRAAIRLPIGTHMEAFISVVNFPNVPNKAPAVLGTFRTGEATIFSWDVAVQKARTAIGFSNNGNTKAVSSRTVGFLAQSNYPPGIDGNPQGPYNGLQKMLSMFPPPNPNFPNGITIFPGGFPLYRNGQLIGAIGISGDGVDQDDIVGASGTHDFLAPESIRADQFFFRATRLPYAKFPRDPGL
jgi:uncharacterized protein GlcG (DUF336 family)